MSSIEEFRGKNGLLVMGTKRGVDADGLKMFRGEAFTGRGLFHLSFYPNISEGRSSSFLFFCVLACCFETFRKFRT